MISAVQRGSLRLCSALSKAARAAGAINSAARSFATIAGPKDRLHLLDARPPHPSNNVPVGVREKVGRGLYLQPGHPLGHLCNRIRHHFESGKASQDGLTKFKTFDQLSPVVTASQNFDDLLTPKDHVSRKPTDTFYVDESHLLRCHMTAHQTELLRANEEAFLMVGDVFRRDEIDATHYPIFHQVDGVRVWTPEKLSALAGSSESSQRDYIMSDLKFALEGMVKAVIGAQTQSKWVDAYFPFTDPSLEMEISFEGRWLEVLGCGKIRGEILANCTNLPKGTQGWAFGMGLERLAMVLFDIPDIRLFWSTDERFLSQFSHLAGIAPSAVLTPSQAVKFKPYSKYPPCYKDVTFWLPQDGSFHENNLFEVIREVAGDLVESVKLLDEFTHPKSKKTSRCYRINYRSMDRSLTNEEVDALQTHVRKNVVDQLKGELR